jgi:F0F1-type ATP synthase membrane subunit c/vacuolar-type H+-ATPase subunit K
MSDKTCFAACAVACLTGFTLAGCSGVDPYHSVAAGHVVAETGTLFGDLFVIIAILAALVLIAVSLMVRFVKAKSGTADSGFADQVGELPRKSATKLVLKPDDF